MSQLTAECPHCHTERSGFTLRGIVQDSRGGNYRLAFLTCNSCQEGLLARLSGTNIDIWTQSGILNAPIQIEDSWPKPQASPIPLHLPDNVQSFLRQAQDSLSRRNFDAAGTMFRKALDTGLRHLHPDGKGDLYKRIESLPNDTGVTPAMRTWAHAIRALGNDAAHECAPMTEADARSLAAFTDLFLRYAFTLPAMIKERQHETHTEPQPK